MLAQQVPQCLPRESMVRLLADRFSEAPVGRGLNDLKMMVETSGAEDGGVRKIGLHQEVSLSMEEALGVKDPGWAFELAMERCVLEYLTKVAEQEQAKR